LVVVVVEVVDSKASNSSVGAEEELPLDSGEASFAIFFFVGVSDLVETSVLLLKER
jgi:hypothetical protein